MSVMCFVINLAQDTGRRERITQQLEALKLPYVISPAVYGKDLSEEELATSYDKERAIRISHDLTLGEIGCALSHVAVYREMLKNGVKHALILEDDASLGNDVPEVLSLLEKRYSENDSQIVLLNYIEKYKKIGAKVLSKNYSVVGHYGEIHNAHGYFITLAAAKKLAKGLFPIWLVADQWLRFEKAGYVQVSAVVPYCIGLSEFAKVSNLTEDRVARMALYPRTGFLYHVNRIFYKKFLRQIIRPFLRVGKQRQTW